MALILNEVVMIMNTISKIILALSVFAAAVSCNKIKGPVVAESIVAEWHLVSVSGMSSTPEVYINFAQDLSFELYQKVGEGRFRMYQGTYAVTEFLVSGVYSDGEKWGSDYEASFDGDKLVMTAQNGSAEVCTYEKKALPDTDKAAAVIVTKSAQDGPRFF